MGSGDNITLYGAVREFIKSEIDLIDNEDWKPLFKEADYILTRNEFRQLVSVLESMLNVDTLSIRKELFLEGIEQGIPNLLMNKDIDDIWMTAREFFEEYVADTQYGLHDKEAEDILRGPANHILNANNLESFSGSSGLWIRRKT